MKKPKTVELTPDALEYFATQATQYSPKTTSKSLIEDILEKIADGSHKLTKNKNVSSN